MTEDPNRHPENGDGERVVVRDRRRVDPDTGAVLTPDGDSLSPGGAEPLSPGGAEPLSPGGAEPLSPGGAEPLSPGGAEPLSPGGAEQPSGAAIPKPEAAVDPRVAELTAEVAERTADLQRLSAEYANYRRRVDRDRETVLVTTRAQFVGELLTVLDDIERAGAHGDLTGPFKSVADKLVSVVQKLGLEPFGVEGEPFDPSVHEAVHHEISDVTGPTVTVLASVLRRGYRIGDRVLRPAMVGVVDRADDGTTTEEPATVTTEPDPPDQA